MTEPAAKSSSRLSSLRGFELMKKAVLEDFPRLTAEDSFCFGCHSGLRCFNVCCGDVNIVLTPYDVLRMRARLALPSGEFLRRFTLAPFSNEMKLPVVLLKMNDDEKKSCPFVGPSGCSIYEDRPWPCRMYPVGMASSGAGQGAPGKVFYFLMHETPCDGFSEPRRWTIAEWMKDQGVGPYDEMGAEFARLTLHPYLVQGRGLEPAKVDMFTMACYDQDRFRRFLFESSFFKRFDIDEDRREKLANSDLDLLTFAFRWLRFSLFGEKTEGIELRREAYTGLDSDEKTKDPANGIQG
jgi:Fe-S-cluster containining protein